MTEEFPEIPDLGLSAVLSIVTGTVTEVGNALFGEQGARQKSRDAMYAPKEDNAAGNRQGSGFGNSATKPRKPRKPPKPRKKKSFIEKVPTRKSLRSTVGFGGKPKRAARLPRGATKGDIRRTGISSLKRGNKALAAFIAARYSPEAIAKYQDYAGRLRRSIRLRRQVVQIDAATFRVRRHIVKTDTAGNNPYSCTCPDFSQFSDDARNWLGSKAGPFNPCKHMMAVRDRFTGGGSGAGWNCNNGVCTFSAVSGVYATKALCEAAVIPPLFFGGQCPVRYRISFSWGIYDIATNTRIGGSSGSFSCSNITPCIGPLGSPSFGSDGTFKYVQFSFNNGTENVIEKLGSVNMAFFDLRDLVMDTFIGVANPSRCDGGADDCGDAAGTCP